MDKNILNAIMIALLAIFSVLSVRVYFALYPGKNYNHSRFVTRVGIFAGLSAILYVVEVFTVKLPFFPSFLSLHFDEIPAFIAGFAYGPLTGFFVILIKTAIKLPFSQTLWVGELTDLLLSSLFVVSASIVYKKKRNLKGVAIGFAIGTALQVIAALLLNVYAMVPLYMNLFGMSEESLLGLMQKAIPAIKDVKWSYAWLAVLPFNLLKNAVVIAVTFIIYRSLHVFLRFEKHRE